MGKIVKKPGRLIALSSWGLKATKRISPLTNQPDERLAPMPLTVTRYESTAGISS